MTSSYFTPSERWEILHARLFILGAPDLLLQDVEDEKPTSVTCLWSHFDVPEWREWITDRLKCDNDPSTVEREFLARFGEEPEE